MIRCTVGSIEKAFFLLELLSTDGAAPCHEPRLDVDVALELVRILVKLFDEVQSELVVRAIPELNINKVSFLFDCELC